MMSVVYFKKRIDCVRQKKGNILYDAKNNMLIHYAHDVSNICEPLKKYGITGFIFMRHFSDGSFIDLSNQIPWSLFFLERFFSETYNAKNVFDHFFIEDGVSLWSCNPDNIIWQEGQALFDFGNGISITTHKKEYKDIFCFYGNSSNYSLNNFYINNMSFLRKFCDNFLNQAATILRLGDKNKFIVPKSYLPIDNAPQKMTTTHVLPSGLFSAKELKCIELSAQGMSAQEIADTIFLSKRTIESHLANAKSKLNCKSISELIYIATKKYFID